MDDFKVLTIVYISQINPLWLIPSVVIMALTLVCYCYHCHQCIRDRRTARIEDQKALLPLPLSRLSIIPGYNEVASTKLTHSRNSVDIY
ncbi:hemotin [Drosophila santomea]|uniref:hemotin n=1 Tax=Drosophila santomea TaxID=129105 RepID=UPI00195350C4|nr:hemotin [Drosophila santomea]XP_039492229.1 hemotin [Drosophila santomea]